MALPPPIRRSASKARIPPRIPKILMQSSSTRPLSLLCAATMLVLTLASPHASAGDFIAVGTGPGCTEPTIQAAIERAADIGGYSIIRVSNNNDPAKVWYENVYISNADIDIIGGYLNCQSPTPTGSSTISGSQVGLPTMRISGNGVVNLDRLVIRDGDGSSLNAGGGIDYRGHGVLGLANTTVTANRPDGIAVHGQDGQALLELQGAVVISDNRGIGVYAEGSTRVYLHSIWNQFIGNDSTGLYLRGTSSADIASSGNVFVGNGGYGIAMVGTGSGSVPVAYFDSINPDDPLTIAGNRGGAILVRSENPATRLCARNLRIDGNGASDLPSALINVVGNARFEMNTSCNWSTPVLPCTAGRSACNSVSGNLAASGYPLFRTAAGGGVVADRLWIEGNTASSIFSTNLGAAASGASITVSNTVVKDNTLRDNVAEALQQGRINISASTVAGGTGSPTFLGRSAGSLAVFDTIVARPELLLDTDSPGQTGLVNVLSPHRLGARPVDSIVEGAVEFEPGSICLRPSALGIDHAGPAATSFDVFSRPRVIDNVSMPNIGGARDIGACENQATSDRIFGSGFERPI